MACPFNRPSKGLEADVAAAIIEHEEMRQNLDLSLVNENGLNTCGVCGCYLKLKVWVPWKHLRDETDPREFPAHCWVQDEARADEVDGRDMSVDKGVVDQIIKFYKQTPAPTRPLGIVKPGTTLTNLAQGLGDALILSDMVHASGGTWPVWSNSGHWRSIAKYCRYYTPDTGTTPHLVDVPMLVHTYDCGNGHFTQRIRRACGVQVDDLPKPQLYVPHRQRIEGRVIMHFDPGIHAQWQKTHIHPRARQLYPENKAVLERFIKQNSHLEWIEVGAKPQLLRGSTYVKTPTTDDLIELCATADYFLGIISGVMHLCAAFQARGIVLINFPDARKIFLPTLKPIKQVEAEWFYPQNVHLHQDVAGPLVPKFSEAALTKAFNGEVYPFWSYGYLPLIHEKV